MTTVQLLSLKIQMFQLFKCSKMGYIHDNEAQFFAPEANIHANLSFLQCTDVNLFLKYYNLEITRPYYI